MNPQPQQQLIPEVITYPNVQIDVQTDPSGAVILIVDVLSPVGVMKRHAYPMNAAYAEALGKKLSAPRVVVAAPGAINGKTH